MISALPVPTEPLIILSSAPAWNYSTTTGSAEFWVLVPTIAASPAVTSLRMYWGNAAATDLSSGSNVFTTTNNYVAVWHMNAATGTSELDATGSGHDAVQNGSPATVVGPSGDSAKSFDGTTQYYRVNNSSNARLHIKLPCRRTIYDSNLD